MEKKNIQKKIGNILFSIFSTFILFGGTVLAEDVSDLDFCSANGVKLALQIVGYLIWVVKLVVPIILIVYGTIDVSKAVINANDALQKNLIQFAKRCIAAVLVFMAPGVINGLFNILITDSDNPSNGYENQTKTTYKKCFTCLFEPNKCDVKKYGE